jgi:segregation and condensation protein A
VERLLEHERFKNAAQMLQQKQMLEAATWTNPGIREFKDDAAAEPEIAADTTDLVRIFRDILERARNRPVLDVEEDSVTVGQMIRFLGRRLTMEDKPVSLSRLLSHTQFAAGADRHLSWRCWSWSACRPSCCARTAPSATSSSRSTPALTR